ncbi:YqaH family protein [Bacillus altitudinis]|uniref:YqaH family protein n=1 Tax=Bacillus altitudinis TaxID=293387 RepID=UPI0040461745
MNIKLDFYKSDQQKAIRLIESVKRSINDLAAAIEENDFASCIEVASLIVLNCEDLKRMEIPSDKLIDFETVLSRLTEKGLNVESVKKPISGN